MTLLLQLGISTIMISQTVVFSHHINTRKNFSNSSEHYTVFLAVAMACISYHCSFSGLFFVIMNNKQKFWHPRKRSSAWLETILWYCWLDDKKGSWPVKVCTTYLQKGG